jgi:hypothetical protein
VRYQLNDESFLLLFYVTAGQIATKNFHVQFVLSLCKCLDSRQAQCVEQMTINELVKFGMQEFDHSTLGNSDSDSDSNANSNANSKG